MNKDSLFFKECPNRFGVEIGKVPANKKHCHIFSINNVGDDFTGVEEWLHGKVYYHAGCWMWVESPMLRRYEDFPEDEPELKDYHLFMKRYNEAISSKENPEQDLIVTTNLFQRIKRWLKKA